MTMDLNKTDRSNRGRSQILRGRVVSDKMDKTRVIDVKRHVSHGLYLKSLARSRRVFFHDEKNESKEGDMVTVASCRPLSRHKHFRLLEVVEKRIGQ